MPASGPGFHVTTRASWAFSASSKVAALTATPVGMVAMATTPGMLRAALVVDGRHGPLERRRAGHDGRHRPGTSRSSVNFARPVTMSRASMRVVGLPMTLNDAGFFGVVGTAGTSTAAASADSDP